MARIIQSSIGQCAAQGYSSSDTLNQKYALTERDKATGLDHTWFRKLENQAGRWTSPDPYNGSMSIGNPQSFNRYSHVENQPTNFVDPSGLQLSIYRYFFCEVIQGDGTIKLRNCITGTYVHNTPDPSEGGEEFPGGGDLGGGGDEEAKEQRCKGIIAKANKLIQLFLKESKKYNPETDAQGGFPIIEPVCN
ncbi:hypothetical protein BH18ACI1_BH18ACI1_22180 [soil metagenome]